MSQRRICSVSADYCLAPAGVGVSGVGAAEGEGSCRACCYHCGDAVCGNCSIVTRRKGSPHVGNPRRVCLSCCENGFIKGIDGNEAWRRISGRHGAEASR